MKLLGVCRLVLAQCGLNKSVIIAGRQVPSILIRTILLSLSLCHVFLQIFACIVNARKGINAMLIPLHIGLAASVQLTIYIALMLKRADILKLLDYLQRIVDERMWNTRKKKKKEEIKKPKQRKYLGMIWKISRKEWEMWEKPKMFQNESNGVNGGYSITPTLMVLSLPRLLLRATTLEIVY